MFCIYSLPLLNLEGTKSLCIPTKEIRLFNDNCPTFDVCRKYDEEEGSELAKAKCIPPVDAMCLDRFWAEHAGDVRQETKLRLRDAQDGAKLIETSNFRFCDPFKSRQQFECTLTLEAYRKPVLPTTTDLLSDDERLNMIDDIRQRHPQLFDSIYDDALGQMDLVSGAPQVKRDNQFKVSLKVIKLGIARHWCPYTTVRHGEREQGLTYVDPWLVYEGRSITSKRLMCSTLSMQASCASNSRPN